MSIFDHQNFSKMESLNALFEHATEGIIISDKAGKIIKANPSSERLFGYEPGELAGKIIEDLVPMRYNHSHVAKREAFNKEPAF